MVFDVTKGKWEKQRMLKNKNDIHKNEVQDIR